MKGKREWRERETGRVTERERERERDNYTELDLIEGP